MFESAELGHKVDKDTFKREVPKLRAELLDAQYDMLQKKEFPVVILISGVDGSGKGETINLLYSWLDPRHISTLAFSEPSDEETSRPYMWRYWRALPPKGKIGIFAGSWYSQPITDRIKGDMRRSELDGRLDDINRFETMLVNEGALVLKFWFHLSKEGQKTRLKALEKDPRTAWRVTKESYERLKTYNKLQQVAGHVLRVTNTAHAPWIIVEGTDDEYRSLTVGRIVLDAMKRRLSQEGLQRVPVAPPIVHPIDEKNVLSELDLKQKLDKKTYEMQLAKYQARLSELARDPRFVGKRSLVLVFEGADAAGKGGVIKRVAQRLNP
ncbi:MAG: polyphosphate:AMP phosphotransferase, partial [Dechloromonas sp.]|nr:polyphosphate:AMP phosphotransferase [Dechloromonas sp.]